jgi:hypothetical protein
MRRALVKLWRPLHWAGSVDDFGWVTVTSLDRTRSWREPNDIVYPVLGEDNGDFGGKRFLILTPRGVATVSAWCAVVVREANGP